jgi:uncharacterized DUF497 family protein
VEITFDPAKRDATLRDRNLDFLDAAEVFAGRKFEFPDNRFDYGETRIVTVGFLLGRMVIVVWTERGEARHVISMRKANEREKAYFGQRLGQG